MREGASETHERRRNTVTTIGRFGEGIRNITYRLAPLSAGFSALLLLSSPDCHAQAKSLSALTQEIPPLMKKADIPGLSIAIIQNGVLSWVHNFGVADRERNTPVTDQTLFSAASLSKTVFAYIVLQLSEEGKIDLDTPLSHYWPTPITDDPRLNRITARIVLSHRTGFPDWRPHGGQLKMYFKPGERFSYSGQGYV